MSNPNEFSPSNYILNIDSVTVTGDDLTVFLHWSFGANENNLEQEKFASTSIFVFPKQNGLPLKDTLKNSGIYKEMYEQGKKHSITNQSDVSFIINNLKSLSTLPISPQKEFYYMATIKIYKKDDFYTCQFSVY